MSSIIDQLLAQVPGDAPVRDLLVGVHWTAVCTRQCGLASTITGGGPHGEGRIREAGRLHLKSARELAEYARSDNPLEASIGIATINSLLEVDESRATEANALEVLTDRGRGKSIALVGHFPFIPQLKSVAGQLSVIEQQPTGDEYPASAAPDILPRADVVAITGSTIINHTLDTLLALCRPGAVVLVVGASAPLSPVLFAHGATILCGARVRDEHAALQSIHEGAMFPQIEGLKLVTLDAATRPFGVPPP